MYKDKNLADILKNKDLTGIESMSRIFRNHFPDRELVYHSPTEWYSLPDIVISFFEGKSRLYILTSDYHPHNFDGIFTVEHPNFYKTYIATQVKKYCTDYSTERLVYLVDVRQGNIRLGHGEIRVSQTNTSSFFNGKPFPGYNCTEEQYQHQGFGKQRIILMNALSQSLFNLPLHSDILFCGGSQHHPSFEMNIWENLVKEGIAYKYKQNGKARYAFH